MKIFVFILLFGFVWTKNQSSKPKRHIAQSVDQNQEWSYYNSGTNPNLSWHFQKYPTHTQAVFPQNPQTPPIIAPDQLPVYHPPSFHPQQPTPTQSPFIHQPSGPNILGIDKHTHTHSQHTITKHVEVPVTKIVQVPQIIRVPVKVPVYINRPSGSTSTSTTNTNTNVNQAWPQPISGTGPIGTGPNTYLPTGLLTPPVPAQHNIWSDVTRPIQQTFDNLANYFTQNGNNGNNAGNYYGINFDYVPSRFGGLNGGQGYNTYAPGWKW